MLWQGRFIRFHRNALPLCHPPCSFRFCTLPALAASGFSINRSISSTTFNYLVTMMLALLFLSLATFGYLCYVLLKPEKF